MLAPLTGNTKSCGTMYCEPQHINANYQISRPTYMHAHGE